MYANYTPLSKYPSLSLTKLPDKFEYIEGERASGKRYFAEKCLEKGIPVKDYDNIWEELYDNYEAFYDEKTTSIIIQKKVKEPETLEQLLDAGLTFKQSNAVMKERNKI